MLGPFPQLSQTFIYRELEALARRGHQFLLVSTGRGALGLARQTPGMSELLARTLFLEGLAAADTARAMAQTLAHRGPDGDGLYAAGPVALAHRRLAILDLEGGVQPMHSADGRYVTVYNGEIYNYRQLRDELTSSWQFRTTSDTEVILAAFARWGAEAFDRLHGMFAFALWDATAQQLHLVRDPLGIKPLYLASAGSVLYFASEMKAIRRVLGATDELNPPAVNAYFLRQYIGGKQTIRRGIRRLLAGYHLRVDPKGTQQERSFWRHPTPPPRSSPPNVALAQLAQQFDRAVERHLVSDVPVGVFLSGGLDSSLVVEAAARRLPGVCTFSVGFGDASVDEVEVSRQVAQRFGTTHYELLVDADQALSNLPTIVSALDQPLADYAIVPTYVMSRFAAERVKVVLGGEGADEVFGGYLARYRAQVLADRLGARIASWLPIDTIYGPIVFDQAARRSLLGDAFLPDATLPSEQRIRQAYRHHKRAGPINAALFTDTENWLVDDLLLKIDAMGMLASLEARVPYLDRALVELVAGWPGATKIGLRTTKRWLRQLAKQRLPEYVVRRPKKGFTVPVGRWLAGPLRESFIEVAFDAVTKPWLRRAEVGRLWRAHENGARGLGLRLWAIYIFARWLAEGGA